MGKRRGCQQKGKYGKYKFTYIRYLLVFSLLQQKNKVHLFHETGFVSNLSDTAGTVSLCFCYSGSILPVRLLLRRDTHPAGFPAGAQEE